MVCGDTELHRVLNHPQESSWLALGGSSGKKGREEGNQSHGVGNVCCVLCLVSQSCLTLCDSMDHSPPGTSVHRDSLGENTGVGCHALLQGIFQTRGSNLGLLHRQANSLQSEPPGMPLVKNSGVGCHAFLQGSSPLRD